MREKSSSSKETELLLVLVLVLVFLLFSLTTVCVVVFRGRLPFFLSSYSTHDWCRGLGPQTEKRRREWIARKHQKHFKGEQRGAW
jgi:hypothetical protein